MQQLILQISWHVEFEVVEYSRKKKELCNFEEKLRILEDPLGYLDLISSKYKGNNACLIE